MNAVRLLRACILLSLLVFNRASAQWEALDNSPPVDFPSCTLFTPSLGYVVGMQGRSISLYALTDNGTKWSLRSQYQDAIAYDVYFASPAEGWIVGQKGLVLHTRDSGITWERISFPTTDPLNYITIDTNSGIGWILVLEGNAALYQTTDRGQSWMQVDFPSGNANPLTCIALITPGRFWGAATDGTVWEYNQGQWLLASSIPGETVSSFYPASENTVWCCTASGSIYMSTTGGSQWIKQYQFLDANNRPVFSPFDKRHWTDTHMGYWIDQ